MAEGEEPVAQEELQEVLPLSDEDFEARRPIFEQIFADCKPQDVKEKSRAERKEHELDSKSLTYGEVDLPLVHQILNTIKTNFGPLYAGKGVFLDLGSGVGKACLAAALLHPFEKVVGVETLQSLSDLAEVARGKYQEAQLPEGATKPEVQFIKGDFVNEFEAHVEPLAPNVSVCLAVATCYGEKELQAMASVARRMPPGSVFVAFSQGLPEELIVDHDRHPRQRQAAAVRKALSSRGVEPTSVGEIVAEPPVNDPQGFTPVHTELLQVPWGAPATVFVYKKVPPEAEENPEETVTPEVAEVA